MPRPCRGKGGTAAHRRGDVQVPARVVTVLHQVEEHATDDTSCGQRGTSLGLGVLDPIVDQAQRLPGVVRLTFDLGHNDRWSAWSPR